MPQTDEKEMVKARDPGALRGVGGSITDARVDVAGDHPDPEAS